MERLLKRTTYRELNVAIALLLASLIINVISVVNRPVKPIIVHNAAVMHGKITGKEMLGKLYTSDCGAYGKVLVTKEQYDSVSVGDDIPSYLKGRGQ